MELKWLCIVFAFVSTLRLSEGQTAVFTSVDGFDFGIVYDGEADEIVGFITETCTATTITTGTAVEVLPSSSDNFECYVASKGTPTYTDDMANHESITSGAVSGTAIDIQNYIAPSTIQEVTVDSTTAASTTVYALGSSSNAANFVYDCLVDDSGTGTYFAYVGTNVQWSVALANDDLLFQGTIRCLFSNQDATDYEGTTANSYREVVDIILTPPLATDATITCSLNPNAEYATPGAVVGTYAIGADVTGTDGCTATTTPADLLELHNAANCYGQVKVAATASLDYGTDDTVTLTVTRGTTTGTCTTAVSSVYYDPTCSADISARVDLTYWRTATTTPTEDANVVVNGAIATSYGNALTYSIHADTTNPGYYDFTQNTLQVVASQAASIVDGEYPLIINAVVDGDATKTVTCPLTLTVGPGDCVPP